MAFNPFHGFRKHQKKFMALLTVMCMIIFVFQFGAGDVFSRVLSWFHFWGVKGDYVTTLYGDKVTDHDLDRLRRHRKLAQEFMGGYMLFNQYEAISTLLAKKPGSDTKSLLPPQSQQMAQSFKFQLDFQMRGQQSPFPMPPLPESLDDIRRDIAAFGKDPQQLNAMQSVATIAATYAAQQHAMRKREPLWVFGGDTGNQDLLDFMIWKHQADRLGITLTDADIGREINRMFGGTEVFSEVPFAQTPIVHDYIRPLDRARRAGPETTADDLLEALRNEFRVQLAKEAILGHGAGWRYFFNRTEPTRVSPAAATPYEFLDYFRDQRTTLKVTMLDIPTSEFITQVTKQPDETELRNFYEEYKEREPKPDEREPGFKEPRRIRVAYFKVNPESPFYQKEGKAMAEALSRYSDFDSKHPWGAALRVAAGFNASFAGGFPAWVAQTGLPLVFDPLEAEYRRYLGSWPQQALLSEPIGIGISLQDRRPANQRPETWAAVVGQALGASQTGLATPLAAASLLPGLEAQLQRMTLRAFASQVLAGASRSPFTAMTLPMPFTEAPQPRDVVWPMLVERYEKDISTKIVADNVSTFQTELRKLKAKPSEAEAYVAKAIKQYGFEVYTTMPEAVSIYEVGSDPALSKLKDAYSEAFNRLAPTGSADDAFSRDLSAGTGSYEPMAFQTGGAVPTTWAFWRVEDKPPRPRRFEDIRAEVEHAWRVRQARQLAMKKAEEIKRTINEKKMTPEEAIHYLTDQKLGHQFTLTQVARQLPSGPGFLEGAVGRVEFKDYKVPHDKIAYPPADFLDRLLTLKEQEPALVMSDRPGKHIYVAVLDSRSQPTWREFAALYEKMPIDDPLYQQMMIKHDEDLDKELMKQLRLEAATPANIDDQGNIKIPEGIRGEQAGRDQM
jgi:hypothetical protein